MKKYFCFLCCLFLGFSMFGFSIYQPKNYVDNTKFAHVVVNNSGVVTETFAVNLTNLNVTDDTNTSYQDAILTKFEIACAQILVEFNQKVNAETDLEKQEVVQKSYLAFAKKEDNLIFCKITFSNVESWQYFCKSQTTTVQNMLFVKRSTTSGRVGSVTNIFGTEMFCADLFKDIAEQILDANVPLWRGDGNNLYSYTYVTPYKRRHSSSKDILFDNDVYYHQWLLDEDVQISFWVNYPVYVWWYVVGVGAGVCVGLSIFLYAFFKNKSITKNEQ